MDSDSSLSSLGMTDSSSSDSGMEDSTVSSMSKSAVESDSSTLELFDDEDEEMQILMVAATAASNSCDLFQANELLLESQESVDRNVGVRDVLTTMRSTPSLFKTLTTFTVEEFELLCSKVALTIATHARSTGVMKIDGRRPKLSPHQRLLAFILHLKHDNSAMMEAFQWNWAKSSVSDDAVFISSCINECIADEIRWPTPEERERLRQRIPEFPGCIGFIDGTLCKIRRPFKDPNHRVWFNGRTKIYALNNTIIVDHDGLFIYVDCGYPGSFRDVNILRQSDFHRNWPQYFRHDDEEREYLLGDPGYLGEEMYIMRRLGEREIPGDPNLLAIDAYNKMHAGYRVAVEWGIGGLKRKWKRMLKTFDCTK